MEILIKGMEMPKAQFQKSSTLYHVEGTIFVYPDGKARAELSVDYKERKSYPLVPVPPHGNLKDADAFRELLTTALNDPNITSPVIRSLMKTIITAIDGSPIIIPAEED